MQNVARETILFETRRDGKRCFDEETRNMVMLTREAYSLNLAPVGLGEKVAVLLSYEDPTRSTVRLFSLGVHATPNRGAAVTVPAT